MSYNIGIIGAGKVGYALALAFSKEEYNISGVYCRNENSFRDLCVKIKKDLNNDIVDTVKNSNIIFLSVSDNSIQSVVRDIVIGVDEEVIKSKTFFHLSGALSSDVLSPLKELGAYTGSIHPIQTFADKGTGWKGLYNICYGFEGDEIASRQAQMMAQAFNGNMVNLKKEDKPLYHAAACIISNYTVTLSYIATELLAKVGFDDKTAKQAFLPLVRNTINNLDSHGSINALTGPISRGDYKVVSEHLEHLSRLDGELCEIYKVLGRKTIEIALCKGSLQEKEAGRIESLLS